ncbi:cyclic pyranopterin monophosphate synthase MoaC [Methanobrevibacter sp. DSM 116169]|uniref:cyclic pyranopterin monophosphate synthase MoaC n=1 Tax=Methanobrevibacter sp. DSM 116169 TaxID=3242727 RepID=UPI0038FCE810
MENKKFTHLKDEGVHMVEVGSKNVQKRTAIAQGRIYLSETTIEKINSNNIEKGSVLTVAQVAGIQAVKKTSELIPLCHPLNISGIEIDFELKKTEITCICSVRIDGKTGVEMEAITGVSVALLTIWDMVKSVEKDENGQYPNTKISEIEVIKKEKI